MLLKRSLKYWPEIIFFGVITGLLVIIITPNLSWMMVNSDVGANILAAKYFYPEHGTGEPLSILIGRLFLFISVGSDSWRMGLSSTLATLGGMIFIYLTIRKLLKDNKRVRIFAILASLIFGSSMLVISQSGIVQLYSLVTMLSMGAFYFSVKKNWLMVAVMIGLGLATHHLILLTWVVLFIAHKEMRSKKVIFVSLAFLAFYLYQPITRYIVGAPDNWVNTSIVDFIRNNYATGMVLIGGLSIWDFPARFFSTMGIVGVSLGLGMIPLVWWLWKVKKWKNELLWLFVLPIIYYITDLAPDTAKYFEASMGFGAIIAVLGLSKLNFKWSYAVGVVAVGLFIFNINYFDVGRTLDPKLSAQRFYDEELSKIPDGQIFMTNTGWQWQLALLYNKEEDRNIIPICIGTLTGEPYLKQLERLDVKLERNDSKNMNERQALIARSILELNDNVWMDITTEPTTYGAKVIQGDNGQIDALLSHMVKTNPTWKFKPSNPYYVLTGAIQISQWQFLTLSNYNMQFFIGLISVGLIINWFLFIFPKRRNNEDTAEAIVACPKEVSEKKGSRDI